MQPDAPSAAGRAAGPSPRRTAPRAAAAACGWSDCSATDDLLLYAGGRRCPLHTPAALRGQLEPHELLALAESSAKLRGLEERARLAADIAARPVPAPGQEVVAA